MIVVVAVRMLVIMRVLVVMPVLMIMVVIMAVRVIVIMAMRVRMAVGGVVNGRCLAWYRDRHAPGTGAPARSAHGYFSSI